MENLVFLKNQEALTDSLTVAEKFGKRHDHVLRDIQSKYREEIFRGVSPKLGEPAFFETWYKNEQNGERYTKYLMNEEGFCLLAMGFTGKKAKEWKKKYIKAFATMKTIISEKSTEAWLESRQKGQLTRKAECDTLKKLVDYAKSQGSEHADKLYTVYTKLANTVTGISNRDEATVRQLTTLDLTEHIILHAIDMGILEEKHYKDIYKDCKSRVEAFADLTFIGGEHGHQYLTER